MLFTGLTPPISCLCTHLVTFIINQCTLVTGPFVVVTLDHVIFMWWGFTFILAGHLPSWTQRQLCPCLVGGSPPARIFPCGTLGIFPTQVSWGFGWICTQMWAPSALWLSLHFLVPDSPSHQGCSVLLGYSCPHHIAVSPWAKSCSVWISPVAGPPLKDCLCLSHSLVPSTRVSYFSRSAWLLSVDELLWAKPLCHLQSLVSIFVFIHSKVFFLWYCILLNRYCILFTFTKRTSL